MEAYLDNAATTMVDKKVVEAMLPFFSSEYGNPNSLHEFGQKAKEAVYKAREYISKSINCDMNEIVFNSGGTEGDNHAIKGVAYAQKEKGKHIITSKIEHPAVIQTCKALQKEGYEITYLGVDEFGFINLDDLKKAIRKDTILVSIMFANNEIGTIQKVKEIGKICKEKNVYFHTDAVQALGKVKIDVKDMKIDLMSTSSHKIHGPKGMGFLYIKKGVKVSNIIDGGGQEYGKRSGTVNTPGIIGMAKALELMFEPNDMFKLRDKLIKGLLEIPNSKLNGPKKDRLSNNVNVVFKYIEGESILLYLSEEGISVSTGSACSSNSLEPSKVLLSIGLKPEQSHGSIRVSLSRYTTEEQVDYFLEKIKVVVEKLRKMSPFKGD
jgi:cysteine desulfurase